MDQPSLYPFGEIASRRQSSTIYTLDTGSLIVPSLTQLNQSPTASPPHSTSIESDHTPDGSTTSQQAEEAHVIVEPPLSTDYTPHLSHTQGFTSRPLATDSTHIAQATSVAGPSVPESIGTAVTWDPNLLVPGETSDDPGQSAPSAAEIATTNLVWSDDPTPEIHTSESRETSQAPVSPSLIFQDPEPVSAVITPSTRPDPGSDPNALQDTASSASLSHPLQGNKQQDTVAAPDEIQSTVDPIPRSIPTAFPAIVVSDSSSSPNLLPTLSSGVTTAEPHSFVGPAPIPLDHVPHVLRPLSSSQTTASSHDTHDLNLPIPMTILLHSDQTARPAHDIVAATLQPEDQAQHDLDKL
jgi:hypothetical protein